MQDSVAECVQQGDYLKNLIEAAKCLSAPFLATLQGELMQSMNFGSVDGARLRAQVEAMTAR